MTYTPINWQTGDTITAEKMNKMDNGWGFQYAQLFSETVTTAIGDFGASAVFLYNDVIDIAEITVRFNGVDYSCARIDAFNAHYYGGFSEQGPDFSEYPFAIQSQDGTNSIFTANPGTYTVAISADIIEVGNDFSNVVNMVAKENELEVVSGVTTWAEADSAIRSGKTVYSYISSSQKALYLQSYTDGQQYVIAGVTVNFSGAGLAMVNMQASSEDGVLS